MATKSMKIVRGKRVRVTRLEDCGTPPTTGDACGYAVSSGFVTVTMSPQNEEGEELLLLNADGELCVNDQSRHNFKRWNLSIELCDVDPEMIALLTKVTLETDADGNTVGFRSVEGRIDEEFAFELWSGIADQDCADGEEYGYLLFPFVSGGTFADLTIENGVATMTIENAFSKTNGSWDVGPYDVVPDEYGAGAPLGVAIQPGEHHVQRLTTIAPPAVTAGCQPAL
jgi:hypothetical protein